MKLPFLMKDPAERHRRKQAKKKRGKLVPPPKLAKEAIELCRAGVSPDVAIAQITEAYTHPADISVKRALAVWAIAHNQAGIQDWDTIDEWVSEAGLEKVLDDIERILAANGISAAQRKKERAWWKKEIGKPGPN